MAFLCNYCHCDYTKYNDKRNLSTHCIVLCRVEAKHARTQMDDVLSTKKKKEQLILIYIVLAYTGSYRTMAGSHAQTSFAVISFRVVCVRL